MAKVEVQIRSCFCCGLSVATILIALYSLIVFALLTGLGSWGLSNTANYGDATYNSCELEAEGKIAAENRKLTFSGGNTKVVVEDTTSYHCSLGLYTEEMKYSQGPRYSWLVFDVFLWVLLIFASILLIVGISLYMHWLLVPWMILMAVEIVRGLISTFFIFWFSHTNLARIATGLFFLGLQFFHISILMIIVAKFQRIYNKRNGIVLDRPYDQHTRAYPGTMVSNYTYSPDMRRDQQYYPEQPNQPAYYGRDPQDRHAAAYDHQGYGRY